ncbi:uncharacterized protein BDZ99DRAFT_475883 [Mytilinidion resinicola]|uniref:Secreted protein n=1 Tax=Mytilinidion resinicola TaxID=574789 RepID=A0A6A6YR81_9PEZI|nr:uncharacterized protein BDZ99DRAFT_475883 [Mytilinidion resinicola]KAF2811029.1 hypothetical protein BDZ99DRAFT_475883 [Mytilinidion resinicola]
MLSTFSSAFTFLYFLSAVPQILAADCFGGEGVDPDVSNAWQLRQQICGNNACDNSDAARGDNHYCSLYTSFNGGRSQVQIQRNDPAGKYGNCWAATEDIIKQCLDNSSGSGITGDPNGSWRVGDEWYWVSIYHNDLNDPSGEVYDAEEQKLMFGPNQFCQGLSPGGGNSCINIPDNCYIEVPLSNSVPKVKCPM